jgi:hypothetical protein
MDNNILTIDDERDGRQVTAKFARDINGEVGHTHVGEFWGLAVTHV